MGLRRAPSAAASRSVFTPEPVVALSDAMKIRDVGSILRLYPLGEHGAIICWCTAEHGIVRTAARSALKPGSELSGCVDLFHECELVYRPSAKSDLATLVAAELISPRLALRGQLTRLRLASYMSQLLMSTVETGAEEPHWHELIAGALDYTAEAALRPGILYHFEKRLAELHGLYAPGIIAHDALRRHFAHLPAGREELIDQLQVRS